MGLLRKLLASKGLVRPPKGTRLFWATDTCGGRGGGRGEGRTGTETKLGAMGYVGGGARAEHHDLLTMTHCTGMARKGTESVRSRHTGSGESRRTEFVTLDAGHHAERHFEAPGLAALRVLCHRARTWQSTAAARAHAASRRAVRAICLGM